jgi:hypothetical protein
MYHSRIAKLIESGSSLEVGFPLFYSFHHVVQHFLDEDE